MVGNLLPLCTEGFDLEAGKGRAIASFDQLANDCDGKGRQHIVNSPIWAVVRKRERMCQKEQRYIFWHLNLAIVGDIDLSEGIGLEALGVSAHRL